MVSGDGPIGFTIAELEIRCGAKCPLSSSWRTTMRGGSWPADRSGCSREPIASLLGPVDYGKVAQGFGARVVLVENPHDLTAPTRHAVASGRPTVIEVPLALLGPTDLI